MRAPPAFFLLLLVAFAAAGADHDKSPENDKQRLMLNEGYSMLHSDASKIELMDLTLYVKTQSDEVDKLVTAASDFAGKTEHGLERVAKDYPGVRIDLDPLPEMEKRKRYAIAKDRAVEFAPIIGHGGREYERTILIALSNGINHERHLCQVMAEAEPDASLKKFLLDAEKRYDDLYDRITALLEKEYFKDPNGKTKD
jgi:hypothetical protein